MPSDATVKVEWLLVRAHKGTEYARVPILSEEYAREWLAKWRRKRKKDAGETRRVIKRTITEEDVTDAS